VYLVAWLVLPVAMLAVRSATSGTSHNVRYVLGSLPAFVLLVAFALRRHEGVAAAGAFALWLVLGGTSIYRDRFDPRYRREEMREAAAYLRERVRRDDRIVVTTAYQRLTLRHYLRSRRYIEKLPVRRVERPVDAMTAIVPWTHGGRRTWVVLTREWDEDPSHHLRDAIEAQPHAAAAATFPGVAIYRVEPLAYGTCLAAEWPVAETRPDGVPEAITSR
jgi:hypothetical protein